MHLSLLFALLKVLASAHSHDICCLCLVLLAEFTLPNGMKVWQWQKGETEFLYTEIFKDTL